MNNQAQHIHVITTGGTIEKSYDEIDGSLENRSSIIQSDIIAKLRLPYAKLSLHNLMAKDSLLMTDDDRSLICSQVDIYLRTKSPVIVLHGTDTMEQSANYCHEHLQDVKSPVIFTGAMRPLGFENSDAFQNVVEAIFAANHAVPGIYICFHGRLFPAPYGKKNRLKGTFELMEGARSGPTLQS